MTSPTTSTHWLLTFSDGEQHGLSTHGTTEAEALDIHGGRADVELSSMRPITPAEYEALEVRL